MEDYLQYMKTLRSQMNDVEDQAAKISVEEQMQITTIQTLEKDLELAYADVKRLKAETDQMVMAKGQICSQILEKQRKISSLESDSSTLSQTLELIQQEGASLSAKLVEKSNYYATVAEATRTKLQEQQEWLNSFKIGLTTGQDVEMNDKSCEKADEAEGKFDATRVMIEQTEDDAIKNLMSKLESAKAQLEMVSHTKLKLTAGISETTECVKLPALRDLGESDINQSIVQVRGRIADFKPELEAMNLQMLEEENQALLSDKAGEAEYLHSLQQQFEKLKGISHIVNCSCGEEYKVEVNLASHAQ